MPRSKPTFYATDVKRALSGVIAAGAKWERVQIARDGSIVIYANNPDTAAQAKDGANPWDEVLK